jgi:hypothetical protein
MAHLSIEWASKKHPNFVLRVLEKSTPPKLDANGKIAKKKASMEELQAVGVPEPNFAEFMASL